MKKVIIDQMFLTTDSVTNAGSKMLENYVSLFEAEAVTRLKAKGYEIAGKAKVGEFAFDLMGESSFFGAEYENGALVYHAAKADCAAVLMDVNGAPRRAAAQSGLTLLKPTYGRVSRYGTIPVACSGETVSVMASTAAEALELFNAVKGHDAKDGTSLADTASTKSVQKKKVAVLTSMLEGTDENVRAKLNAAKDVFEADNTEVAEINDSVILHSRAAWNILMSAELCNNVSRYDGVKYGYRAQSFNGIDELYTASRSEAFGELLKYAILFGSETLSTENYFKVYDKAMRVRRLVVEEFARLFEEYDAVLMPACSEMSYTKEYVENGKFLCFKENFYTAPASISGLPAVVAGGVQLVGKAFSEELLISYAEKLEGAGE